MGKKNLAVATSGQLPLSADQYFTKCTFETSHSNKKKYVKKSINLSEMISPLFKYMNLTVTLTLNYCTITFTCQTKSLRINKIICYE